jgi:hypothetical protein
VSLKGQSCSFILEVGRGKHTKFLELTLVKLFFRFPPAGWESDVVCPWYNIAKHSLGQEALFALPAHHNKHQSICLQMVFFSFLSFFCPGA